MSHAFIAIDSMPRTPNGRKCEVPVKKILSDRSEERAIGSDALRGPESRPVVALTGGQLMKPRLTAVPAARAMDGGDDRHQ